ncbi:MAG TPA: ArgE/DapE family deacylase [Candidatus Acidoferrum sp.]|nr:ArgE/DapE family deacylase [Candidatus Acidoferrum sp.]
MNTQTSEVAARTNTILHWLRQREDEIGALIAELVAVATENPPGRNYRACADLLEKRIREMGLECESLENTEFGREGSESAVCLLAGYGRGERTLYFHGHYDVVPAQFAEQFQPVRKDHFLFGRGTCDMKGGIVAMLFAIRALKECGAELNGRIGLTLVPDEETGGERGSAWLARQGLLGHQGIGMLLPEPTSGVVWNANRGAISLRVTVFGKSAHVGLQHQGENAFERMLRVVEQLQELKREVEKHATGFNIGAEQARNSILMLGGQSGGGANFNVVPETCWFTMDRRINPEEDLTAEKSRLFGVLERCRGTGIPLEWEVLQEGGSAACREDELLGRALARSVETVTGTAPRFEMCPGLLEIRFYAAKGMPAYAYGPGLLSVAHGPKEYVDLRKVIDSAAVYALTAAEILKD